MKLYFKKKYIILLIYFILPIQSEAIDLPPIQLKYSSFAITYDGEFLGYLGQEKRVELKSLNDIPIELKYCLLATEDRDFYNHNGVSITGLGRAVLQTLKGHTQGGSTLTMQLARNLFLSNEKTLSRKFNEIELALELEKRFSKDQIMLMYLNTVYFGRGVYGLWAAAREYFNKAPNQLSINESALLIGLLKGPTFYDPVKHPDRALKRRDEVLYNLVETKHLSEADFYKLKSSGLGLNLREDFAPFFNEYVRRLADNILKSQGKSLDNEVFKITTTLDSKMQKAVNKALKEHLKTLSSRIKNIQLGLVSVEPVTGFIKAMEGGNLNSEPSGLNRAYQIRRQVGSSFKPFLYSCILKDAYTLATPLMDSLITVNAGLPNEWKPENYDGKCSNKTVSMQYAITKSLNLPAVHAMMELTTPEQVADFAMKMGVSSDIKPYPSIALGACESNPLNMASAFAVFASGGVYSKPVAILKIEDANNNTIYYAHEKPQILLDGETSYLMTYALQSVVDSGTAVAVRKFYKGPAAGKTGTTQDNTDAWFIGFTPELSTAIWFGYDSPSKKLGNLVFNGGTIAAPMWGRMMNYISKIKKDELGRQFKIPEKIKFITLCNETGLPVENSENCTTIDTYPVNMDLTPFKTNQQK